MLGITLQGALPEADLRRLLAQFRIARIVKLQAHRTRSLACPYQAAPVLLLSMHSTMLLNKFIFFFWLSAQDQLRLGRTGYWQHSMV